MWEYISQMVSDRGFFSRWHNRWRVQFPNPESPQQNQFQLHHSSQVQLHIYYEQILRWSLHIEWQGNHNRPTERRKFAFYHLVCCAAHTRQPWERWSRRVRDASRLYSRGWGKRMILRPRQKPLLFCQLQPGSFPACLWLRICLSGLAAAWSMSLEWLPGHFLFHPQETLPRKWAWTPALSDLSPLHSFQKNVFSSWALFAQALLCC